MKKLTYIIVLVVATFSLPVKLCAQLTPRMTNKGIGYLEYLPPDYATNPTKKYPLMMVLHGAGEKGDGSPAALEKVKANGPPKEIVNGHNMCFTVNGQTECFIVIAPQLPSGKPSWGVSLIDDVFKYIFTGPFNYRVDMNRVYLTGLSLGSNGVYKYAYMSVNDPNKLAAMSPIAAWGDTNLGCVIAERKIPLWAFHGDQDNTVGYGSGLAMFNSVKDCTTPVPTQELIFTTYAGVGHNSWSRAYRTDHSLHNPNLYEWMLSKSLAGNPTANAGPDKTITLPTNSVTLNGSGTDAGGSITSYSWTKLTGPSATLTNATTPDLTANALSEGVYTFQLTVTDNDGNTATDVASVTVNPEAGNQTPTANAGSDIQLILPTNSTNIVGVASDLDGSISSVSWTQKSGPSSATLAGASSNTLSVSNLIEGTYVFRFTVTDNQSASAFDEVNVKVINNVTNQAPVANAGSNFSLKLPTNTTAVPGSGSDADGSVVSYLWEKIGGPATITITNANSPTVTISDLVEGVYHMQLTVTDNLGATGIDDVYIAVLAANLNPVANAGSDISITLPTNSTNINGSGSDSDGSIQSYAWTQLSGPSSATLSNANKAQVTASNLVAGVYTFELTVTDNNGATNTDDVKVTVNAAPVNVAPVASAGSDVNITLPVNTAVLTGSGTDSDGTIASYAWTKVSGPSTYTLSGNSTSELTASNLVAGTYKFRLTVTDNNGATGSDDVVVSVAAATVNQAPVANAGPNRTVTLPTSQITLDGAGSDADGTISSYNWTQISGPSSATLTNKTTEDLTASNLVAGTYTFQLEVTDDDGATGTDQANVTVSSANAPPVVSAGSDINLTLPTNFVDITGTASDPDGTIVSTLWTQTGGVVAAFTVSGTTISITGLIAGYYTFQFRATDNLGAQSTDDVQVVVTTGNVLPSVSAGPDKSITLPTSTVNLSGAANDSDGSIASYLWTKQSGPAATLVNASTKTLTVNNLIEGTYIFRLQVTDNDGGVAFDEAQVKVLPENTNASPTANAGSNISLVLPTNTTNINGSGSDSDGSIVSYSWTKVSGPGVTITNASNATVTLTNLVEGTYIFRLTVTDDDGAMASDDVKVTVSAAAINQSPVANAGNDINITLPTNSSNLSGSGSDPDGTIASYLWQQVSGPSTATLTNSNLATASVGDLIEGTYIFKLTVTDDDGAQDDDNISIVVQPEGVNQKPFANAGPDQTINLPTNSTNISGSGSDPDGSITTYLWVKTSGPAATLTNSNKPNLTVSNLVEGTYQFKLTVTDNDGETASDQMNIQVLPETLNQSPIADAGSDINLLLPTNNTEIEGSASDNDGNVTSTLWAQISGPSTATMSDNTKLKITVSDLAEGSYVFRLLATDDDGAQGSDQMTLTVLPEDSNIPPVANAGPDKSLFLPTNTVDLNGSGADADGTIDSYFWEKVSGPTLTIVDPNTATATLNNLVEGSYVMRLTVTDNEGAIHFDEALVKVFPATANQSPLADAGDDVFLTLPDNSTTIDGNGSDLDGTIAIYEWTILSGPNTPTISGENTASITLNSLIQGTYVVQLRVEDDGGLSNSDKVNIFVDPEDNNQVTGPVVDAGNDQSIQLPQNSSQLTGEILSGGLINSFEWSQLSGNVVDLTGLDNDTLNISNLVEGIYEFQFTATDNEGLTGSDNVLITVLGEDQAENPENPEFPQRVFSPNGDNIGDFWVYDSDPNAISGCEVKIFDKRGVEIYSSKAYQNDWNGTSKGKELPEGVYYYVMKCENTGETHSGSITLIK